FGLAKLLETEASADSTTTAGVDSHRVVVGTVGYMSPEQVRAEPIDSRSDIFSLGVVLFEILTGARPFIGSNAFETQYAILTKGPPAVGVRQSHTERLLTGVARRCLEKEPGKRYQNATEILSVLGAQVIVTADSVLQGAHAEVSDEPAVVAYREPPAWLVWSGPGLIGLILIAILTLRISLARPSRLTGCLTSPRPQQFVLTVSSRSSRNGQRSYLLHPTLGHDLRAYVGRDVEVGYSKLVMGSPEGTLDLFEIRTISPRCSMAP